MRGSGANSGASSRRFEISFAGPGGHSWSDFGVGNPVPQWGGELRGGELSVAGGLAALSLDALSSVAYGPEAMVAVAALSIVPVGGATVMVPVPEVT